MNRLKAEIKFSETTLATLRKDVEHEVEKLNKMEWELNNDKNIPEVRNYFLLL